MTPFDLRMIIQDVIQFTLIGVFLVGTFRLARTYLDRRGAPPKELREIADRLARLEQAVDTVAIEVERIAETQRFESKLLGDRPRSGVEATRGPAE